MTSGRTCSQCGSPLPASNPDGRCPLCLLGLAETSPPESLAPESIAPTADRLPTHFGDYDLFEELGRGGMGVVFRARQRSLNRIVAVKLILGGSFADPDAIARFRREAEAAASLRHPGIVTVHEFGEQDGQCYLAMEHIEGRSLSDVARSKPVTARQAACWVRELAEIVEFAHRHGVLHRDLKPANILLDESGHLRITDFGLARRLAEEPTRSGEDPELTLSGRALGSPNFMPPEQASGERGSGGPASDVYSLGAILYYLLAGRPPFVAESVASTLCAVREAEPNSPRQFNPSVPRDLETLCARCLEKAPSRRYPRAQDLADELGRFLADEPIRTRPLGVIEKTWRWTRRNRGWAAAGVAVLLCLLVLGIGGAVATRRIDSARREAIERAAAEHRERARAEAILRRSELRETEEKLTGGDAGRGLAILASILRRETTNRAVAERVVNELTLRNWPVPSMPPRELDDVVKWVQPSSDRKRFLAVNRTHRVVVMETADGSPIGRTLDHESSGIPIDRFLDSESAIKAVFSPDGSRIGTTSFDGTARIWHAETGEPVTPPIVHPGPVAGASFSPDGRLFSTACSDGAVRIWVAGTGQPWPAGNPRIFRHSKATVFVTFSPDGSYLLTGSNDHSAQVWEIATGNPCGPRLRHDRELRCGAFSPNGLRVATGEQTGVVRVWDAFTGEPVGMNRVHERIVNTLIFSPNGLRLLSTSHDRTARIWDTESGRLVGEPLRHRGVVRSALYSLDGTRIVTASEDGTARVWDAETGKSFSEPMAHGGPVWWAEFLPDGARVATASSDRLARVWDVRNGRAFTPIFHTQANVDLCRWSPDQRTLLVVAFEARWIDWSLPVPREVARMIGPGNVISGRFRPDGAAVFVGTQEKGFKLADVPTYGSPTANLDPSAHVVDGVFSPDNRWLASVSTNNCVRLWNNQDGQPVGDPLAHSAPVRALDFTRDSRLLLTGTGDGQVSAWEIPSGRLVWTRAEHRGRVTDLECDSVGTLALSASIDGSVATWNLAHADSTLLRLQHLGAVLSASFSPDGSRIVTASADGTARQWEARSGAQVGEPLHHENRVEHATFSPDGRRIATASADWTARVWDAETGFPLTSALTHLGIVHHTAFSPDGRWLATSSSDRTARVWPVAALPPDHRAPAWLSELAEALAGVRKNDDAWTNNTSRAAFQNAVTAVAAGSPQDSLAGWAAWWTADRWRRPLAPDLRGTIESTIDEAFRPNDETISVLESVDRWHPGHPRVQAQVAIASSAWQITNSPAFLARLDAFSAGAVALEPDALLPRWARAAFLHRSARDQEALATLESARGFATSNAWFWLAYGDRLAVLGRTNESAAAHDRALEIVTNQVHWNEDGRIHVRYRRALSRARAGQPAELHAMLDIPVRDPACPPHLVDLGLFYTAPLRGERPIPMPYAPSFPSLPNGIHRIAGIDFDLRGLIGLADPWTKPRFPELPERIDGISIRSRCRRLHFLHTAVRSSQTGVLVARYRIHLGDGDRVEFPVIYGRDLVHWTYPPPSTPDSDSPLPLARRESLWEDSATGKPVFGHLYLGTWENPRPEVDIIAVDFISGTAPVMPYLVAITADP